LKKRYGCNTQNQQGNNGNGSKSSKTCCRYATGFYAGLGQEQVWQLSQLRLSQEETIAFVSPITRKFVVDQSKKCQALP
jgi:hypothetical protein